MAFPRHGILLPQACTQERIIPHLKNFGLVVDATPLLSLGLRDLPIKDLQFYEPNQLSKTLMISLCD
jgi:hypothetical protein